MQIKIALLLLCVGVPPQYSRLRLVEEMSFRHQTLFLLLAGILRDISFKTSEGRRRRNKPPIRPQSSNLAADFTWRARDTSSNHASNFFSSNVPLQEPSSHHPSTLTSPARYFKKSSYITTRHVPLNGVVNQHPKPNLSRYPF